MNMRRFFRLTAVLGGGLAGLLAVIVPAFADDGDILVARSVCTTMQYSSAMPGVDYTAGVDVHGGAVAPADLPDDGRAQRDKALGDAPVKITRDLQERLAPGSQLFHGRSELGYVTVHDGRAFLDGQPLTGTEQQILAAGCAGQTPR